MRITHVTDVYCPGIGGIERQVETLVRRQRADGHDVTVVTADRMPSRASTGVQAMTWGDVAWRPGDGFRSPPDIVHGHLSMLSPLTVRLTAAAARAGIPVAMSVHSMWPVRAWPLQLLIGALGGLPSPAAWSAVSHSAAAPLRKALPAGASVVVVPNEVHTSWWRRPAASCTGVLGDADRAPVHAVLVNRLAGRKRVARFVRMLGHSMPAGLRVTIVGDGPRRDEVAAAIRRHGVADRVHLTGALSAVEIRALLHRADLFIAPARQESFGIAALEARAAGVPVLGFRSSGLADFVRPGRDGLLVESDAALLAAVHHLVETPAVLQALQHAARTERPLVDAAVAERALDGLYQAAGGQARLRRGAVAMFQ